MRRGPSRRHEITTRGGEPVRAFVPLPLPPKPPLDLAAEVLPRLETASLAMGRLDGVSALLPDYRLLDLVRSDGDWEAWLVFFLDGVTKAADSAVATATGLIQLFAGDRSRIEGLGRKANSALRVHDALQRRPVHTLQGVAKDTSLSFPAASAGMDLLEQLGIVREITGKQRNRVFAYTAYLDVLQEGTENL